MAHDNCFIDSISQGVEQEYNGTLTRNFECNRFYGLPVCICGCSWPWCTVSVADRGETRGKIDRRGNYKLN